MTRGSHRGLAPLELVLCLFFLLVVMSLIINFGTTAPWHLRGQIAARNAVWRSLAIRTGNGNRPNPPNWWAPATMGLMPARQFTTVPNDMVGPTWMQGDLMQPTLRDPAGPIIDPSTGLAIVKSNLQYLEMVNQAQIGSAGLTKAMPLLPNMRKAQIYPMQPVLDHFWRFQDMSPQSGGAAMRWNNDWRTMGWWVGMEPGQNGDGDLLNLLVQFQMADMKIQQNPGAQILITLDSDPEFPPWGMMPPDVYPRPGGCEATPSTVQQNMVINQGGLIDQIQGRQNPPVQGVAKRLAQAFISLYQFEIQSYQARNPPNQTMIQQLQQWIQQLQQVQ